MEFEWNENDSGEVDRKAGHNHTGGKAFARSNHAAPQISTPFRIVNNLVNAKNQLGQGKQQNLRRFPGSILVIADQSNNARIFANQQMVTQTLPDSTPG